MLARLVALAHRILLLLSGFLAATLLLIGALAGLLILLARILVLLLRHRGELHYWTSGQITARISFGCLGTGFLPLTEPECAK
ncbi:hypothetical protein GCM10007857_66310 [Bradyrhizobium iriomotense]|uniref:Uncharacterized protein n=1 Tax=Bradyrhizobium iriomotense TaxID=441950 RepID=A0ABQ6B664_9BRAD|nr:hypothetical protein GCM10007857_66310 [Bradyrhizobium iriomotense]